MHIFGLILQDQALKQAADLRANAKDGLHGARLVAADLAKGNAKGAGARVGSAVQAASTSAAVLYMARALVSVQSCLNGKSKPIFS